MKLEELLTRPEGKTLEFKQEPIPDINPEALDFRVASGLIAGLRECNENTPETLRLFTRHQGRLVPNIPEEVEA